MFENFKWPEGVDHLLFVQLFVYYYTDIGLPVVNKIQEDGLVFTESVTNGEEWIMHKVPKFRAHWR